MVSFEADIDWALTAWVVFGVVLSVAVLWVFQSFVGTFVFALFIYYSTRRIHSEIDDRIGQETVSAGLALGVLALPVVLLLLYATAIGLQELQAVADVATLGPYYESVRPYLNVSTAVENPRNLVDAGAVDVIREGLGRTTAYLGVVGTGLLHLFVMFSLAFYLLRDDHRVAAYVHSLGNDWGVVDEYAVAVDRSLERVFAGNILNAVVAGTVGALTYSLLNLVATDPVSVPYPALIGLLAGIASLVPVVGMKLVYVPVAGYLVVRAWMAGSGWGFVALFVAVSFVVVDVIPDLVVRPYVSGGDLHTGSLMFAYILGPLLFGWYGLFLGPVILVFVTHFARIVVPELVSARHTDGHDGLAPSPAPTVAADAGTDAEAGEPGPERARSADSETTAGRETDADDTAESTDRDREP